MIPEARPTCRTSGGLGLSWSPSQDLPDAWRAGPAGFVWSPSPDLPDVRWIGFVLELPTNLVWRVGAGLTELLANIFVKQCHKKFNETRNPA